MLGHNGRPDILVEVKQELAPDHFDFTVLNGRWEGTYYKGYVTVYGVPSGDYSSLEKVEILTDDQDRLRSVPHYDYQEVFNNFDNPAYVAPKPKPVVYPASWDDDIPF
jgi:hypothetical protein